MNNILKTVFHLQTISTIYLISDMINETNNDL